MDAGITILLFVIFAIAFVLGLSQSESKYSDKIIKSQAIYFEDNEYRCKKINGEKE